MFVFFFYVKTNFYLKFGQFEPVLIPDSNRESKDLQIHLFKTKKLKFLIPVLSKIRN